MNELQIKTLYRFVEVFLQNPRMKERQLRCRYSPYRNDTAVHNLIEKAKNQKVISGPGLYCNTGLDVEVIMNGSDHRRVYELWEKKEEDLTLSYAIFFIGSHSGLFFRKGASLLDYLEDVVPSYPAQKKIMEMWPQTVGSLPVDPYPTGWDELDWAIYEVVKGNARMPYPAVLKRLNVDVTAQTIYLRMQKIMRSCKVRVQFFPRGYDNYFKTFLTFKTDYEVGLREELQKLDRTSYLWKCSDLIMLNLFSDHQLDHRIFVKMEKEGLIHDLHVSIPLEWFAPGEPLHVK